MLQGIDTPGVYELPKGKKNLGVATNGNGVPGKDGWGKGGDRNPPTTRETGASKASSGDEGRTGGLGTAVPPHPQQGTAADGDNVGSTHRHTNGADIARPKNGMHTRREYGLLAPT